jgi:hypothetical protein
MDMKMKIKYVIPALIICFCFIMVGLIACSSNQEPPPNNGTEGETTYPWEAGRGSLLPVTDMVLVYGGGAHRNVTWNKDHFIPYVSYTDKANNEKPLFDGFLFLEITNGVSGASRIFATGYHGEPARKTNWKALVDYYFQPGIAISALEQCLAEAEQRLGTGTKRKVVIALPEPIVAGPNSDYTALPANYWGEVDGITLDFTRDNDRITACKWYIDYVRQRFNEGNFQHLELAGFYWLAEESLHTRSILSGVAAYLNQWKYSFNWIPYWKAEPDYYEWKSLKFSYAYLQPNYFFNETIPYSRLTEACAVARQYDMDLELEFDVKVFVNNGNKGGRLRDYMQAFEANNMLSTKRIAYYQDTDALYQLYRATNEQDIDLFHDFCAFVIAHQSLYRQ